MKYLIIVTICFILLNTIGLSYYCIDEEITIKDIFTELKYYGSDIFIIFIFSLISAFAYPLIITLMIIVIPLLILYGISLVLSRQIVKDFLKFKNKN